MRCACLGWSRVTVQTDFARVSGSPSLQLGSSIDYYAAKFARVAQWLERYTDNVEVGGSIPPTRTIFVN